MLKIFIFVSLLICIFSIIVYPQSPRKTKVSQNERLLTDLTKTKKLQGIFGDDGVYLFTDVPEIQRIVRLGKKAIPLLIAHLDDKRKMPYLGFNVSKADETVTLGDVCFDFLLRLIVHNSALFDLKCEKEEAMDSPVACLKEYYFEPTIKQRWLKAYQNGKVIYNPENIMIESVNYRPDN